MSAQKPYLDGEDVYIHFPTGRLTLSEVQQIFSTIPFELDLIDHTDHFAWFSNKPNREHVRSVSALGETVQECHPARVLPHVMGIINAFKDGSKDVVKVPLFMNGHRCLIQYYALRDIDGTYLGTIEFTGSVEDILGFYEKGAWGESTPGAPSSNETDATSSASHLDSSQESDLESQAAPAVVEEHTPDATSGASQSGSLDEDSDSESETGTASEPAPVASPQPQFMSSAETSEPDAVSGASATGSADDEPEEEAPAPVSAPVPAFLQNDSADDEADATTGASAMGA